MKILHYKTIFIILLFFSNISYALNPLKSVVKKELIRSFNLEVYFDNIHYIVKFNKDRKRFYYQGFGSTKDFIIQECNKIILDSFMINLNLYKNVLQNPSQVGSTKYDVQIVYNNNRTRVMRNSELGSWLRDIPTRFFYYYLAGEIQCQKPKK